MLVVENLVCGYSDRKFMLKDITFDVKMGELIGIIGPNGSGKSTLLKALSRILKPSQGKIIFNNKDINKYSWRELAQKMAVVSQQLDVSMIGFSLWEFVLMGRIPHRSRFQIVETIRDIEVTEKAIRHSDLTGLVDRKINELSGGELQRAVIARSLAQEPELLLLDEPTTHLDIGHQVDIMNLVRRLNKNGITVVTVLHDLNLASQYCDRVVLLSNGKIHSNNVPEEILDSSVIEEVYGTKVLVQKHPINSKPMICITGGGDND